MGAAPGDAAVSIPDEPGKKTLANSITDDVMNDTVAKIRRPYFTDLRIIQHKARLRPIS